MNSHPPISTAAAYSGMNRKITSPAKTWMKRLLNRRPSSSGNVWASSRWPNRRVGPPKKTNARKMPTKIFRNASHSRLIPNTPAAPPKPTMALVEMKVAP